MNIFLCVNNSFYDIPVYNIWRQLLRILGVFQSTYTICLWWSALTHLLLLLVSQNKWIGGLVFLLEPRKAQKTPSIFQILFLRLLSYLHRLSNQHGLLVIHKYIPGDQLGDRGGLVVSWGLKIRSCTCNNSMAYERWWPKVVSCRLPRQCRWDILTFTLTTAFEVSLGHSAFPPLAWMKAAAPLKMPLIQHTCGTHLIRTSQNIHHGLSALRPPVSSTKETLPISAYEFTDGTVE